MRKVLFLLLAFHAGSASAQVVYKCVSKGKPVSFQSQPCAPGSLTVKAVFAPPDRYTPPAYQPAPAPQPRTDTVVYNNFQTQPDERAQRRANCQGAKDHRERTLERVGLKRTYDLLQQLDANVASACKGV